MEQFEAALTRTKQLRKLQDEILALFVNQIQMIDDKETLQNIKRELKGENQ